MKDRILEALDLGLKGICVMAKGIGQRIKGTENVFFSRRRGFALQLALVVMLVGSILVVAIYEFTSMALKGTTERSVVYGDQMLVAGYAEKAKGVILSEMQRIGTAIHPRIGSIQYTELPNPGQTIAWQAKNPKRPEIHSANELQIKFDAPPLDPALNSLVSDDRMEGGRRVVLQVFDLTYDATQISSIVTNPAEMQNLPPALSLNSKQKGKSSGMGNEGMVDGDPKTGTPLDDMKGKELDLARFGAYPIRTRIFEGDKLARVTEEAFFQVLQ
ncbi:MAG: hypothetical protein LBS00_12460 [Synergistaceae bacterium]|jgi:hypothetical protein|nr:hypothetical protein [Synergistaceae bacterium]